MFKVFILIALLAAVSAKVRPSFLNLECIYVVETQLL
jgi:hypothetical protein